MKRKQHMTNLFIATLCIILLGTLVTPIFAVNNAEAIQVTNLRATSITEDTIIIEWGAEGCAGTSYTYSIYYAEKGIGYGAAQATGTMSGVGSYSITGLDKGKAYDIQVKVEDAGGVATDSITITTKGTVGIAAIQAVFWNAYAALVAIVWLICIAVAAHYLTKRTQEEDDRIRGKQLMYAVEAIITAVVISILPLIAAMAQGWIQI